MRPYSIIVPNTTDDLKLIVEGFDPDTTDRSEWFLSKKEFYKLFNTGVLDKLNEATNELIDEFEEGGIIGRVNLSQAIESIEKLKMTNSLVQRLISMLKMAWNKDTGVFFYF